MILRALAAAKINLGLEVLRKRSDGFHDVRTILASVSVFDRLTITSSREFRLHVDVPGLEVEDNLVARAAGLSSGRQDVSIALQKRIPAAAGLGGASSDAAATLLLLDRLSGHLTPSSRLADTAAELGSDVPFFLTGGTALAAGRGELLTPLPYLDSAVVIVAPRIMIPRKTATLYASLLPSDFSDGSRVQRGVEALVAGDTLDPVALHNAFMRPLLAIRPELANLPERLLAAGCTAPALSGAGPAFYSLEPDHERAANLATRLRHLLGHGFDIFACRTTRSAVYLKRDCNPASMPRWPVV